MRERKMEEDIVWNAWNAWNAFRGGHPVNFHNGAGINFFREAKSAIPKADE